MARRALLIACSEYDDPAIHALRTPVHEIADIGEVLSDPEIGGFELVTLVNQTEAVVRRTVGRFLRQAQRTDLLLIYFACHGFKEDNGQLFLGAKDTDLSDVMSTALPAQLVTALIDASPSHRTILVLDCCYSGAIKRSLSTRDADIVHVGEIFAGQGDGRAVITASRATEYAYEPGDDPILLRQNPLHSVFAEALIAGLKTGEADLDNDGVVSVGELYDYIHQRVVARASAQTPGIWNYVHGKLFVARRAKLTRPHIPTQRPKRVQRSPFDAGLLSWRSAAADGLWHAFSAAGSSVVQAYRAAVNEDWSVARRLFDQLPRDASAAVRWGRALCDAVDGDLAGAGEKFLRIARDGGESSSVIAGAGLLAAVSLRSVESPNWHEPLDLVLEQVPSCPQALAYRGIHLDDPVALRMALLLAPDLIDDFAAVSMPIDEAVVSALAEAQRRVAVLLRARAAAEGLDQRRHNHQPASPRTPSAHQGDHVSQLRNAWKTTAEQRLWLARRLAAMSSAAQTLLDEPADSDAVALVAAYRRTSTEILDALRQTDLPRPIPAFGIPTRITITTSGVDHAI